MLYKYEDKQGNIKLLDAQHLSHAAGYVAKQEFKLSKVSATEAVALRDKDVPVIKVPEPVKREKPAKAAAATTTAKAGGK